MVVVADAVFVSRERAGGLDSADEGLVGEGGKCVVNGLLGDSADLGADLVDDVVGGAVGVLADGAEDGEALRGDLEAAGAEGLCGVGVQGGMVRQKWTQSRIGTGLD